VAGGAGGWGGLSEKTREAIGRLAAVNYCFHCGLTVGPYELHDARDPCGRCGEREVGVVRIARVGTFTEPLVTLVHRLKFGRSWEIAGVVAPFLYSATLRVAETAGVPVDAMVPVPLHWWRRVRRGFNQAEELARSVGGLSGWPVVHGLRRVRRTAEQARIQAVSARAANLRGAFVPRRAAMRGALAGQHVWLVDDVSTTGATLHAAATALRKLPRGMRPASINAAVLCVADHRPSGASAAT
jgi:ComF family protein